MLTIKKQQLDELDKIEEEKLILNIAQLLQTDLHDVYQSKTSLDWHTYIESKIEQASQFNIKQAKNIYTFILTQLSFPQHFINGFQASVQNILKWPGLTEDDKIIQFCKEIYKQNITVANNN